MPGWLALFALLLQKVGREQNVLMRKTDRIPFAVLFGSIRMALLSFVHACIEGFIAPEIFAPIYYYCYYISPSIFPFFVRLFRLPHQFPVQ